MIVFISIQIYRQAIHKTKTLLGCCLISGFLILQALVHFFLACKYLKFALVFANVQTIVFTVMILEMNILASPEKPFRGFFPMILVP